MIVTEPPMCFRCGINRKLVQVSSVGPDLELREFECPQCGKVLRLKIRRGSSVPPTN